MPVSAGAEREHQAKELVLLLVRHAEEPVKWMIGIRRIADSIDGRGQMAPEAEEGSHDE